MKSLWKQAACVFLGAALLSVIPLIYLKITTGSVLPPILPPMISDTYFYFAQIKDVLDGNLWLGNPHIREYAGLRSASLVLPVWIAAVPGFAGAGINTIFLINAVFYTLVTAGLLFLFLLRTTDRRAWLSAGLAIIGTAYVHDMIVRPAVMQTIFPVFLAFLILLHAVFCEPRKRSLYLTLGLIAVFSFYLYLYLWMIVFASLGLVFLRALILQDRRQILLWALTWAGILVLCLPGIMLLIQGFSDHLYIETTHRIALVNTHLVSAVTLLNTKYILLILAGMAGLRFTQKQRWTPTEWTIGIGAAAIVIATFSNLITGKDAELHSHPWRFGLILSVAALGYFLVEATKTANSRRYVSITLAAILMTTMGMHTIVRTKSFYYLKTDDVAEQSRRMSYYKVLEALEAQNPSATVLAPAELSIFIPMYTRHSVVFNQYAAFHLAPTGELLERFVLQNLNDADETFLRDNIHLVYGPAYKHVAYYKNERNALCRITNLCEDDGKTHTAFDAAGGDAFVATGMQALSSFRANPTSAAKRFGVSYVVSPRFSEGLLEHTLSGTVIYKDDVWRIIKL